MKKALWIGIITGGLFLLASCTGINIPVHAGATNTNPAQEYATIVVLGKGGGAYHSNTVAGQIGNARGIKQGQACVYSVLWLAAWGDASIETAMKSAKITKISSVEYNIQSLMGFFYHKFCTVVWGE